LRNAANFENKRWNYTEHQQKRGAGKLVYLNRKNVAYFTFHMFEVIRFRWLDSVILMCALPWLLGPLSPLILEHTLPESAPLPRAWSSRHRAVCSRHSLCREGALGRALPAPLGRHRRLCREPWPKLSAQLCRDPT
jgi:hypothetical protein